MPAATSTVRGPALAEAAEDWLTSKRVGRRADDPGHADRARRGDLRRWAGALTTVLGRPSEQPADGLSAWNNVSVAELGSSEVVLRALDLMANELSPDSRARALSTLRGFCRWLVRRGLLLHDPTDDEIRVAVTARLDVAAFTPAEVDALLTATDKPPARASSAWPARDAAIVAVLADCGLRVGELCALTLAAVDQTIERPLLRIRAGAKGGKARNVPLPQRTLVRLDSYQAQRGATVTTAAARRPAAALFVRHNGQPLNQPFVDTLLRRLCATAGVALPQGAMAHALRHHFGAQLALRGVPVPVIQQLLGHADSRTTAIYTRAAETALTGVLDEAGWLN